MISIATVPSGGDKNHPQYLKSGLSPNRRHLVELMQDINFGRLEDVHVRDAEPVFNPSPRILRDIKFGGDNGPRSELHTDDFQLKSQIVEMFAHFDRVRDCKIETLEIKHGLPFRMSVRETAA